MSSEESELDSYIAEGLDKFHAICDRPKVLELVCENLFEEFLDEIILGIAFDAHRSYKRGYLNILYPEEFDPAELESTESDTLSQQESVKVVCPKCTQRVGALKFALHLSKCMGLGRNSSRIANMKITNSKDRESTLYANAVSDDETDSDWTGDRKRKKKESKSSSRRRYKVDSMVSNTDLSALGYSSSALTDDKPKQICGVITKHSKKKCRNINCTHHTEQRKAAAAAAAAAAEAAQKYENDNMMNIDVENSEDTICIDASSSNNSSPSDSRKKDTKSRSKSKKGSRRSLSSS